VLLSGFTSIENSGPASPGLSRVFRFVRNVAGLIWIRFDLLPKRCDLASQNRHGPHSKRENVKVKLTIISRFKSFQVFATQKSEIHETLSEVVHGN